MLDRGKPVCGVEYELEHQQGKGRDATQQYVRPLSGIDSDPGQQGSLHSNNSTCFFCGMIIKADNKGKIISRRSGYKLSLVYYSLVAEVVVQ